LLLYYISKDIFPGLSRTLSLNFQDFPGPGILKKKSRTFQEAWEPWGASPSSFGRQQWLSKFTIKPKNLKKNFLERVWARFGVGLDPM